MNPLKALFNKVFDATPTVNSTAPPAEDPEFEWNPDDETVAPTSARAVTWRRENVVDEVPRTVPEVAPAADLHVSAHTLPVPMFERTTATPTIVIPPSVESPAGLPWNPGPRPPKDDATSISVKTTTPPAMAETAYVPAPAAPTLVVASGAKPPIHLSDFEDVYRKAGIKSPVHGYGVERVYRLITSRRLAGLDQSVRRSALLTALDAAGVPASDVSQDAVLRRKALTAYEAEKALELQSLRSRNESRAEALQDTVETFTRQKQGQIERLAQGSTSAVRAQSDLEIRKRMEQDRLFRSLAYFVEALPSTASEVRVAATAPPRVLERFDRTIEMSLPAMDEATGAVGGAEAGHEGQADPAPEADVVTVTPEEMDSDTRPISLSSVDMNLRSSSEEVGNNVEVNEPETKS